MAERFLSEGASVLLTDAAPAEVINDVVDSLKIATQGWPLERVSTFEMRSTLLMGFATCRKL